MGDRVAKQALYDGLASVAKALGNGRRAEIVDVLAQGERRVEDLAGQIGESVANTSHHLQRLLHVGLVRPRREGTRIFYSLSSEQVAALWRSMRDVAAEHVTQLDELTDAYLGDRTRLTIIGRDELVARQRDGDVLVLDVRPRAEYDAGRIPGAVNVPPAELGQRLRTLPTAAAVVAYCRGPYCVYADDAVRTLSTMGRTALRLVDGFPEWAAAGLPVETGT